MNNGKNLYLSSINRTYKSSNAKIINSMRAHILENICKIQVKTIKILMKTKMPSIL